MQVSAAERIKAYQSKYAHLWCTIDAMSGCPLPLMDPAITELEYDRTDDAASKTFMGFDFAGPRRVVQLWFLGTPEYFPAFWVGADHYTQTLDRYPIYQFDLEMDTGDEPLLPVGNFKQYMTTVLEWYLRQAAGDEPAVPLAQEALAGLREFSDETYPKGHYVYQRTA